MTDPFLAQHQIDAYLFNLGGKLFPIAIRDQMVRGQLLVDRAFEAGLIDNEARPLLVIGAGAAGATVAMRAAKKRVRTVLVEKHTGLVRRQRNCRTRWIDPSQYDYPVDHWRDDRYPVNHRACPLPWRADWAHKLAT